LYPEKPAQLAALVIFIGFNLTFFPQFIMGYLGMPRRDHNYAPEFQIYHILSTAGATILGIGYLLPVIYLIWSLRHGKIAGNNPWRASGLEWETTSPPPVHNFVTPPRLPAKPYDYQTEAEYE
jgi:cytochrome c oxidase subunit 1